MSFLLKSGHVSSKRGYAERIKLLELEYSANWYILYILVLTRWKLVFSLKTNSWIGGYQRFITVSAMPPLQETFVKTLAFCKIRGLAYVLWFYWTNIYLLYFDIHRSIHPEVFYASGLKPWNTGWNRRRQVHNSFLQNTFF